MMRGSLKPFRARICVCVLAVGNPYQLENRLRFMGKFKFLLVTEPILQDGGCRIAIRHGDLRTLRPAWCHESSWHGPPRTRAHSPRRCPLLRRCPMFLFRICGASLVLNRQTGLSQTGPRPYWLAPCLWFVRGTWLHGCTHARSWLALCVRLMDAPSPTRPESLMESHVRSCTHSHTNSRGCLGTAPRFGYHTRLPCPCCSVYRGPEHSGLHAWTEVLHRHPRLFHASGAGRQAHGPRRR